MLTLLLYNVIETSIMNERLENESVVYVLKYKGLNENMLYVKNFTNIYVFFFQRAKILYLILCKRKLLLQTLL